MAKDYYQEIDKALQSYEQYKPYHTKTLDWICDRISWCFQYRHISESQMEELADRATSILERW